MIARRCKDADVELRTWRGMDVEMRMPICGHGDGIDGDGEDGFVMQTRGVDDRHRGIFFSVESDPPTSPLAIPYHPPPPNRRLLSFLREKLMFREHQGIRRGGMLRIAKGSVGGSMHFMILLRIV